jgi:hypothetical protein
MSLQKLDWLLGSSDTHGRLSEEGTRTQTISVSGEDCEVTAHQIGKYAWKAYGYVKGSPIHATGETAPAAFSRWRKLSKTIAGE